MDQHNEIRRL